jgi:hypothetical protein
MWRWASATGHRWLRIRGYATPAALGLTRPPRGQISVTCARRRALSHLPFKRSLSYYSSRT